MARWPGGHAKSLFALYHLIRSAGEAGTPLEVVAGSAPGWEDPWSRAQRVFVGERDPGYRAWLDDEQGFPTDSFDVQLARLAGAEGGSDRERR